MNLGQLKQRIADYFSTNTFNLRLKIGTEVYESRRKEEDEYRLFGSELKIREDTLVKVEQKNFVSKPKHSSTKNTSKAEDWVVKK